MSQNNFINHKKWFYIFEIISILLNKNYYKIYSSHVTTLFKTGAEIVSRIKKNRIQPNIFRLKIIELISTEWTTVIQSVRDSKFT